MSWDFYEEFIKEIRRKLKELEDEVSNTLGIFPKDDLDEAVIEPLTSIRETPDCIIVSVDMPFVDPNTVEVKLIDSSSLQIIAHIKEDISSSIIDSTYPKMTFKKYKKNIKLPVKVKKIIRISMRGEILAVYLSKYS